MENTNIETAVFGLLVDNNGVGLRQRVPDGVCIKYILLKLKRIKMFSELLFCHMVSMYFIN